MGRSMLWSSGVLRMHSEMIAAPVRVGIVSTEPIRRAGLMGIFDNHPSIVPVSGSLDLLLADRGLRYLVTDAGNGTVSLEMLFTVRHRRPDMRQIVIGPGGDDDLVVKSILSGARGYVEANSPPQAVRRVIEGVIAGLIWAPRRVMSRLIDRLLSHPTASAPTGSLLLSPRERQVLDLIMLAKSNREIAQELGIEERTVKAYVVSLMRKKGTENRISLSVLATHESWVAERRMARSQDDQI
jgi:DNA-binding NarL/FixJ family response regulator